MKNIWSIIANRVVVDQNSNMISLFDCIEEIHVNIGSEDLKKKEVLIIPTKFEIVSFWEDEDDINKERKAEFIISLLDPNDKKLNDFEGILIFPPKMKRFRSIVTMEGFPFTTEGRYVFRIMSRKNKNDKYRKVVELPIEVIIQSHLSKEIKIK